MDNRYVIMNDPVLAILEPLAGNELFRILKAMNRSNKHRHSPSKCLLLT